MNKNYQMYVGDGTLTTTNDANECYIVAIHNAEGAEDCFYHFVGQGFLNFPDYTGEEEDFPMVMFFDENSGDWNKVTKYELPMIETIRDIFLERGE